METRHASAKRTSQDKIMMIFDELNKVPLVRELLDRSNDIMFVLNSDRQIVFSNKAFIDYLGLEDFNSVLGKRPGEALNCVHSAEVSGCGTTEFCIKCGAVNAILGSQECLEEVSDECLLSVRGGESYELEIKAKPFEFNDHNFTFFTARDISASKRKQNLEKIFFHDIMNLASGIYSVMDLIKEGEIDEFPEEMVSMLYQSSSDMVKEINEYRTILLAEKNELTLNIEPLSSVNIINEIHALYEPFAEKRGIKFNTKSISSDAEFRSDASVIKRVIINMVKNAIEASTRGDDISLWCEKSDSKLLFSVHNPAYIPEDIQLQIFKRTFTTKKSGTGLGSYSMKLLGESYLKGEVSFVSSEEDGTTFTIAMPL